MKLSAKKALPYVILGVLLVVAVAAAILFSRMGKPQTPQVILPSAAISQTPEPASQTEPPQETDPGGVTRDTVQAVIAAMERQDTYMRTISVCSYWSGGQAESAVTVWVSGENTRILVTSGGGDTKHILICGDTLWIWYDDGGEVYTGPASGADNYDADTFQGIITYEEVLELDASDIIAAEYTSFSNEPCVYVEYSSGQLGYITKAYISVDSGLLIGAEVYDGEQLIYSMDSLSYEMTVSSEDVFQPPETTGEGN